MTTLRPIDATALAHLNKALIGFDRIFTNMESRNMNQSYPPYNILKYDETHYELQMAVAGFEKDDLKIIVDQDQLFISGEINKKDYAESLYIHRGLATRNFERSFTLPQYMEVDEVSLTNGILSVKLSIIVPDALKPRVIDIK